MTYNKKYQKKYYLKNKKKQNLQSKIYRVKNEEKLKLWDKKYYQKNKKRISLRSKEFYKKNKEKLDLKHKEWRQKNKEWEIKYNKLPHCKYRTYRANAKQRNREFNLTYKEFLSFWQKPCHYCGDKIETIGLDRIDNKKGYVLDNIISCCAKCNYMKRDLSKEEFIKLCQKIYYNFS